MARTLNQCGKGDVATKSLVALFITPIILAVPFSLIAPAFCYGEQRQKGGVYTE